ncbi:growth arrest-specific protein 8-like [Poecilia latipinna]|uniref:growth arrest-specific protein 8-like n=1 Tax=Poecilia latipinna TaxID=48699 RepID=UPI00072DA3BE|nr:PREDICTED: growth arrest-specific protein 8-like [Poecilia latipinna]
MPPKKGKKGKKGKAGKVNPFMLLDSAPIQEMTKDQLWDFALRIQEELETVRKEKGLFQPERDKTQTVWETTKKNLEESEVQLRNTTAERSEVDERHREEMTVYKQKMKHVLSEQHNAVSEVKTDAVTSRSLQQKQNTDLELDLRRQLRNLQMDNREKRLQEHSSIKMLKLNHQRELMRLGGEFERRMQVLEVQKLVTTRSLAETFQRKLMNALTEIDTFNKCHLVSLNKEHDNKRERTELTFEEFLDTKHYEHHTWKVDESSQRRPSVLGAPLESLWLSGSEGVTSVLLGFSDSETCFQEILESKRTAMEALQLDLDQGAQEYEQLLRSLKGDLEAAGILLFQFPFKAAQKVLEEVRSDLKVQPDRHQKDIPK